MRFARTTCWYLQWHPALGWYFQWHPAQVRGTEVSLKVGMEGLCWRGQQSLEKSGMFGVLMAVTRE